MSATGEVGGTTIRNDTSLPLRTASDEPLPPILAQPEQSISLTPPAAQIRLDGHAAIAVTAQANATEQSDAVLIEGRVTPPSRTIITFEIMKARSFALENVVLTIPPGLGHNRGPDSFKPWSADDEKDIIHLIALLKQQTPTNPVRREELAAAAESANKIADKLREYADDFFKSAAKKGGEKLGESLFSPAWWFGVSALIAAVVTAISEWLGSIPF